MKKIVVLLGFFLLLSCAPTESVPPKPGVLIIVNNTSFDIIDVGWLTYDDLGKDLVNNGFGTLVVGIKKGGSFTTNVSGGEDEISFRFPSTSDFTTYYTSDKVKVDGNTNTFTFTDSTQVWHY